MPLPAELPGSSSSIFYRGKDGLKTFFFSLKEKMTDGVISIVEWRKFRGKHFLFNVCIKVGVGKGAEHMTFNMDPEWCVIYG